MKAFDLWRLIAFQDGRIPLHYTVVGKTPELARQLETMTTTAEEDPMAIEVRKLNRRFCHHTKTLKN